jgi:hypothetical protein
MAAVENVGDVVDVVEVIGGVAAGGAQVGVAEPIGDAVEKPASSVPSIFVRTGKGESGSNPASLGGQCDHFFWKKTKP